MIGATSVQASACSLNSSCFPAPINHVQQGTLSQFTHQAHLHPCVQAPTTLLAWALSQSGPTTVLTPSPKSLPVLSPPQASSCRSIADCLALLSSPQKVCCEPKGSPKAAQEQGADMLTKLEKSHNQHPLLISQACFVTQV